MSSFEDVVLLSPGKVSFGVPRGMSVHRTVPTPLTTLVGARCFVGRCGPDVEQRGPAAPHAPAAPSTPMLPSGRRRSRRPAARPTA